MFIVSPHFIFSWRSQFYFKHARCLDRLAESTREVKTKRVVLSRKFSENYYRSLVFPDFGWLSTQFLLFELTNLAKNTAYFDFGYTANRLLTQNASKILKGAVKFDPAYQLQMSAVDGLLKNIRTNAPTVLLFIESARSTLTGVWNSFYFANYITYLKCGILYCGGELLTFILDTSREKTKRNVFALYGLALEGIG